MKQILFSILVSNFISASVLAAEIHTPRVVDPMISINDEKAVKNLLISYVEEIEERKDIEYYLDDMKEVCKDVTFRKMTCEFSYLQDRWNGQVKVEFNVWRGRIMELSKIEVTGNF